MANPTRSGSNVAPGDRVRPQGLPREEIDGVPVTLVSAGQRMMLVDAASLGKTGHETAAELDADRAFLDRLEALRREAGRRMGLGDVANRSIPKPVLLSPPCHDGGTLTSRYFRPHDCHPSHAAAGAVGIAAAAVLPGTIAAALAAPHADTIVIEHPSGTLPVVVETDGRGGIASIALVRTARRIFEGRLHLPPSISAELRALSPWLHAASSRPHARLPLVAPRTGAAHAAVCTATSESWRLSLYDGDDGSVKPQLREFCNLSKKRFRTASDDRARPFGRRARQPGSTAARRSSTSRAYRSRAPAGAGAVPLERGRSRWSGGGPAGAGAVPLHPTAHAPDTRPSSTSRPSADGTSIAERGRP